MVDPPTYDKRPVVIQATWSVFCFSPENLLARAYLQKKEPIHFGPPSPLILFMNYEVYDVVDRGDSDPESNS